MNKEQQLQFISIERIPERGRTMGQKGQSRQPSVSRNLPAPWAAVKRKRRGVSRCILICIVAFLILAALGIGRLAPQLLKGYLGSRTREKEIARQEELLEAGGASYPKELLEMLERNEETTEFVESFGERSRWLQEDIDLKGEVTAGRVPLLMQWDRRWGYDIYGDGMVGWAGCGPVCMTMAYLYLTEDTSMDPRKMAEFADVNGYHTQSGTSWDFWTAGAGQLGLFGEELPLGENIMKGALDNGGVVVCSMGPGDFTTTGHYILLRGYDENGFFVNDPNRKSNSEKQWSYEELQGQIKNLWGIYQRK